MRKLLALCVLGIAGAAHAQTPSAADLEKGLTNLAIIHDVAFSIEFQRNSTGNARLSNISDPWGTPYRLESTPGGSYRIVSAGSDKTFDEQSWATHVQFDGLAGDVVFADGGVRRTNRNWLATRVSDDNAALQRLRDREMQFMVMRSPEMLDAIAARTTIEAIRAVGNLVQQYRDSHNGLASLAAAPDMLAALGISVAEDAWRTPLRIVIEGQVYRIVSAGSDRKFSPETWSQPITVDAAEDVVFENGTFKRALDIPEYMREKAPKTVTPLTQPPDTLRDATDGWYRAGGGVTTPEVKKRVEPVYPGDARRLGIAGLVILQVAIGAKGDVQDVRVIKSLSPDIDLAAINAVRQWQFAPATLDRNPVPVLFNVTINFRLK